MQTFGLSASSIAEREREREVLEGDVGDPPFYLSRQARSGREAGRETRTTREQKAKSD